MSGSPKYSSVALAAARRAQAAAERAQRARRREEELQRRLAAALQLTRTTTAARCASLASRAAGLGQEATEQMASVRQTAAEIAGASNQLALAAAGRRLDLLEWQIDALSDAIGLRQEAAASARLAQLAAQLGTIPRAERLHLDAAGGQAAERALDAVASAPGVPSGQSLDNAARRVAEHLGRVRSAQAERATVVRETELRIEELSSRLGVLEADGRDLSVKLEGAEFAHDYLDRLRKVVADGRLGELSTLLPQAVAAVDRTEQTFDEAVDRVIERRRILASVVAGLPDLGFGVIADSLVEQPDGSVSVRAQTVRGQTLDVLVHDGEDGPHEVLYSSSELEYEETAGGITGATCGSLVDLAGALNDRAGQAGYITGKVSWDDGGPDPDSGSTSIVRPSVAGSTRNAR
ncbi:hypothetical protein OHA70_29200 [Kribbella sp. NBC_00382]|uniref:hypothetical protein n=1 Tax=Kribbella sp. NBC_00382 TaxID=2975967 RepID=UPI002E1D1CFF